MKDFLPDDSEMLRELVDMMETDAVSGNEKAVAVKLRSALEAMGFNVSMDDAGASFGGNCGNLFAYRNGELPGALLFSAHMDRVPNGFGIRPSLRDGVLYSDGTTILAADDLAGVCAVLNGLRILLSDRTPSLPRLEVLFTVGEETGLWGAKAFDLSAKLPGLPPPWSGRIVIVLGQNKTVKKTAAAVFWLLRAFLRFGIFRLF